MKRGIFLFLAGLCVGLSGLNAQNMPPQAPEVWEPQPPIVTPGELTAPPSDAIVLFDGSDFDEWEHLDGSPVKWKLEYGAMVVVDGAGDIRTKRNFEDVQLHLEFRTPAEVVGEGQGRGNSGVFLQSTYEVQVLDNYDNKTYANGQVGSIYKQTIPLANPSRPPGEWQTYDIIYTAPEFNDDGIKVRSAYVTVLLNGVLVQNHTEIRGTTPYIGLPKNPPHGALPLRLQDHDNPTAFRNIWIREL